MKIHGPSYKICYTLFPPTAIIVTRKHLNVTRTYIACFVPLGLTYSCQITHFGGSRSVSEGTGVPSAKRKSFLILWPSDCQSWRTQRINDSTQNCHIKVSFIPKPQFSIWHSANRRHTLQKYCTGKAIPLQALTSPEGSRRLRLPDFKTIVTLSLARLSALRTGRLYPRKYSWYSFLLWAESTPGP
jgi:hypothetical protein